MARSAVFHSDRPGHPATSSASVDFASASATIGFQIVAVSAASYGALATSSTTANASHGDPNFRQIATSRNTSAADCRIDNPIPPACGRLSKKGPTVTRISHSTQ